MAITDTDLGKLLETRLLASSPIIALVVNRIRPNCLKVNETMPAIRYEMVSSQSRTSLGESGAECVTRMQFDCYGATNIQAAQVAAAVKSNLDGLAAIALGDLWIFDCIMDNRYDMIDPPAPGAKAFRHRRTLDFIINHTEPEPTLT